jgi:hypothetical protein
MGADYQISNNQGEITIIGASEDILAWRPVEACSYQETLYGASRAIVCPVPTDVVVTVGLDANGQPAEITVTPAFKSGIPAGVPK